MVEENIISSEIYDEFNYATNCTPTVDNCNIVSRFPFTCIVRAPVEDCDGDLLVQRRSQKDNFVEIEHSKNTVLDLVGHQVWRGALLLADWLIYNNHNFSEQTIILELGSGTGLTSIVAAMFASVICTDVNKGNIFKLVLSNIERNNTLLKHPIQVMELDFTTNLLSSEIMDILPKIEIVLAADVIYDNELTESFINTIRRILLVNPCCSIYIALEKRYVFTTSDYDTIAPCYEFFLEIIKTINGITVENLCTDFPQSFKYDRVKELVLWKVTSSVI